MTTMNYSQFRRGLKLRGDNVGSRGDRHEYLPRHKLAPFKVLYRRILDHAKTREEANRIIGISSAAAWNLLNNKRLSKASGEKIVDAYNRIKEAERNAT